MPTETSQSLSMSNSSSFSNGTSPMNPPATSSHQKQPQQPQQPPQIEQQHPQPQILPDNDNSNPSNLRSVVANVHQRVASFLSEPHPPDSLLAAVQRQTRSSLHVVNSALDRYRLSELSLSYNGGKDCLVLLILFLTGLHEYFVSLSEKKKKKQQQQQEEETEKGNDRGEKEDRKEEEKEDETSEDFISSIPAIYALPPDPFPDVENFVRSSSRAYHLSVARYTTDPPRTSMRSCFESYLSLNPGIKAIFVGTRRTDPHGENLKHFDPTDGGWPDFMRIHPVLDWHYAEIWAFIRHLRFEYCPLYDLGYTSLGSQADTHPNPKLRLNAHGSAVEDHHQSNGQSNAQQRYYPAYNLKEDVEERLGRA